MKVTEPMPEQKNNLTPPLQNTDDEIINHLDLLTELETLEELEEWDLWENAAEILMLDSDTPQSEEDRS